MLEDVFVDPHHALHCDHLKFLGYGLGHTLYKDVEEDEHEDDGVAVRDDLQDGAVHLFFEL